MRSTSSPSESVTTYPRPYPSVSFVATLIENGTCLTGSTHEPCVGANCSCDTLFATLLGSRHDSVVTFVKTYDAAGPHFHQPIAYEGTLSEDATEIEGRWTIRRLWSGKFLMIRSTGRAVAVSRKAFVPAT
jgi:hypothetical protein